MIESYYFRCKNIVLAPVYATNELDAWVGLVIQHSWIGATRNNSTLIQVLKGTEWDRIVSS